MGGPHVAGPPADAVNNATATAANVPCSCTRSSLLLLLLFPHEASGRRRQFCCNSLRSCSLSLSRRTTGGHLEQQQHQQQQKHPRKRGGLKGFLYSLLVLCLRQTRDAEKNDNCCCCCCSSSVPVNVGDRPRLLPPSFSSLLWGVTACSDYHI